MQFMREINRLLFGVLVLFGIVALAAAYWAVAGPDTILKRSDNPRLVEAEAAILRGSIADREGTTLVDSQRAANGSVSRDYRYPSMASALGYYSLRYGVGGAEAAFNATLRGDTLSTDTTQALLDSLLHKPQEGADVQLTLDLSVQDQIAAAMDGQRGAVVVLSVPDGAVLALVSLPTYDANTLDANWDQLIAEPGNPFFNRVLQGRYQPGGALETPLMAAAFLVNHSVDETFDQGTNPVLLDGDQFACAVRLPAMSLSLREAYGFACPHPFAQLADELGAATVQATMDTFRLDQQPTLEGFDTIPVAAVVPPTVTESADQLLKIALGQGDATVNPLNMAMIAAAIVNDGNTPQPYLLMGTRAPGAADFRRFRRCDRASP